jgi:hypothetical protein
MTMLGTWFLSSWTSDLQLRLLRSAFLDVNPAIAVAPRYASWDAVSRCGSNEIDLDDLLCGHNGIGVVREIDIESGVHRLIRVIRGRVLYHRDLVAKLSGKADGCLHARVCDEPDDDELMNAVLLQQQIEISVGEAAGAPMLLGNHLARPGLELGADLATPSAVFEALSCP